MTEKQSLAKRAVEAITTKAPSAELKALYSEIGHRLTDLDQELHRANLQADATVGDGDIEALRAVRQLAQDLKDEEKILRFQSSEIYQALKIALGEEAVENEARHDKTLAEALAEAQKAQAVLANCRRMVQEVIAARRDATEIGATLTFDRDTVRALSVAIHSEPNLAKQCLLDLGAGRLREARHA